MGHRTSSPEQRSGHLYFVDNLGDEPAIAPLAVRALRIASLRRARIRTTTDTLMGRIDHTLRRQANASPPDEAPPPKPAEEITDEPPNPRRTLGRAALNTTRTNHAA